MRILYAAIDQTVPGTVGGSVHVTAVAEGLAELGHEVQVLVAPGDGMFPAIRGVRWTAIGCSDERHSRSPATPLDHRN